MERENGLNSKGTVESILLVLCFLGLIYALYDVLKVFLGIFTFSLIFAVSFAGLFEKMVRWCRGRRSLAAIIYAILLIGILVQPLVLLISNLSHHVKELSMFLADVRRNGLPALPPEIGKIPVVGPTIAEFYAELQDQPRETIARHGGQIRFILHEILTRGAGVFGAAVEIVLGIIISAFLLSGGDKITNPIISALKHILGREDTDAILSTSAMAIRGVSIGIIGTAFLSAIIAWVGLFIAGVPFSLGVAALVFFLVIIQVGPLPVWIPVVAWLFIEGHTGMAVFMIIYGIGLLAIDAVIKPVLIAKSGRLPFLVIFTGVIGGLVAWGFTGMFKGAIIVAVFYTLFVNWLERKESAETAIA